jgi:hypothetical protein
MGTHRVTRTLREHKRLIFCMVCVAVPRLWGLEHPSFTCDELWDYSCSTAFARHLSVFSPISEGYVNGQLPFFSVLPLYAVLGWGKSIARLQSVAVSLLSIFLVFLTVKRLHGYRFGLIAVVLLGFCPFFLSASRLAFTHGHIYCTWSLLAGLYLLARLRDALATGAAPRVPRWLVGGVGLCMGVAVGSDLLAGFWSLSVFLLLCVWMRRSRPRVVLGCFAFFAAGGLLGLLIASPMYATGFPGCIREVREFLRSTDRQTGFLWLGHVVEHLPRYYYGVVLATKLTPVILVLLLVTAVWHVRRSPGSNPFGRTLLFLLWPMVYLSLKPTKTPYYLTPFVPVLYILLVDGLHMLWVNPFFRRRGLVHVGVLLAVAGQLYAVIRMHPDYLMQGIRYSDKLYGEFMGPAVSHGQWVGEALRYIREDARGKQPIVYAVTNMAMWQIRHYSAEYGVRPLIGEVPPVRLGRHTVAQCSVYILITRDAKEIVCPVHEDAVRENRSLVSLAENSREYALVKTYYSGCFSMVWVYKSIASRQALSAGGGLGVVGSGRLFAPAGDDADHFTDFFEVRRIDLVESMEPVRIDVEHGDQIPRGREHRHDNFRPRGGGARDIAGETGDVGHELRLTQTGGRPADAPVEGNRQTPVGALIGTDLEQSGRHHPIEAGPIEIVEAVMKRAHDRGHDRNRVRLTRDQVPDVRPHKIV